MCVKYFYSTQCQIFWKFKAVKLQETNISIFSRPQYLIRTRIRSHSLKDILLPLFGRMTKTFNHELSWFIGVVERVTEDCAYVSYMSQMGHDSMTKWKFPETARVHYTPLEQTIAWNFPVEYRLVTIPQCSISKATENMIKDNFLEYITSLNE